MLIIDLDNPTPKQKPAPITVVKAEPLPIKVEAPKDPIVKDILKPVAPPPESKDQKAKILAKLEEEDKYVRYNRAMNHAKIFDQLGPDLLPVKGADFSQIYQEQGVYRERLASIYLKQQQLEKTGTIIQPKIMTDADLARLGALKHDRSNGYKNASKLKKKIEEAKIKNNLTRVADLEQKLGELELKIMEYSHEIKKIEKDGLVS